MAWTWEPRRGQYYLHNFLSRQPDLNFHNPDVQRATLDNFRFWLDRGVDGLRLDAINFCFHDQHLRDNPPRPKESRKAVGFKSDNPYGYQWHRFNNTQPEMLPFLEADPPRCSTSIPTWSRWAKSIRMTPTPRWPSTRSPGGCTWDTASSCSAMTVHPRTSAARSRRC